MNAAFSKHPYFLGSLRRTQEFSTCPWDHIWRLLEILSGEFARRDSWHKEKVVLKLRAAWEFQLALDGFCKIICSQVSREGTIR